MINFGLPKLIMLTDHLQPVKGVYMYDRHPKGRPDLGVIEAVKQGFNLILMRFVELA